MRIISGKYGKRRFPLPTSFKGRPTTDMAKEGLFNILANRIDWEQTRVLDLFAGSGSIGFECLSRGAKEVFAVEKDPRHASFIKSVEETLGDNNHKVQTRDALKFIEDAQIDQPFDFIFADPPYALSKLPDLPSMILGSSLLAPDGLLVVEHPRDISFGDNEHFVEERNYGSVHFSFFTN